MLKIAVDGSVEIPVRSDVRAGGTAIDRAGEASAGVAAPDSLHDPKRAAADGTARLQSALSLVRRTRDGRSGVGRDHLLEEPRAAAASRCGAGVLPERDRPSQEARAAFRRALYRRRHTDRGMGEPEELQAKRWRAGRAPAFGDQ